MGLLDRFRRGVAVDHKPEKPPDPKAPIAVAAKDEAASVMTFTNKSVTYTGDLVNYDYDSILRDKQKNIIRLYELSDYFVDVDPIYRGIIKGVYTPFSLSDNYRQIGASEKTKQKYEEYYERIHLMDRMRSIMYQYFKYGNVFVYVMEDGNIITLPVHLVRIANIMVNGEPVVELNCRSIKDDISQTGTKAQKDFVEDDELTKRLEGYPTEVANAVQANKEWVQLNPENTFVLQDMKEDWARYAVPMIATALAPLARKAQIGQYEGALLNLGIRSFVHVSYGDPKEDVMPDINALNQVNALFRRAMTGNALATTNHQVKASVIQPDTKNMFDHDKYREVNAEILSAGGISGIIVSGRAEDGSNFASAQVSMQTAAMRIKQARDNFCELMSRVNARLNGVGGGISRSASGKIPKFTFPPVDLAGAEKFQQTCYSLWKDGVLSTQTLLQVHGCDLGQEVERMRSEQKGADKDILQRQSEKNDEPAPEGDGKRGRPAMDDSERSSDPAKSMSGKQPKPSNPEGSE